MREERRHREEVEGMAEVLFLMKSGVESGVSGSEVRCIGTIGRSLLDVAIENGVPIEHSCGGMCACSTCHVYIESGHEYLNPPGDIELDRVEEAPALQTNSRLSCQCIIQKPGRIIVRIPSWKRNTV